MAKNNSFKYKFYGDIMPKIYGIGASIVILGAMFKILDWQGASLMIGVGLTTEALIFSSRHLNQNKKKSTGQKFILN